jgi:plasmid stabilization system protein ParE
VRILWTQQALDQLTEIADTLMERSPASAQPIVQRILDRVAALADLPWSGPLPDDVVQHVQQANEEELDRLGEQLLTVNSLTELFR